MRPFQIKSRRTTGLFAGSRGKYLEMAGVPAPRSLCQVQVRAQWNLKEATPAQPSPTGMPWLTLVLGSGCLEPSRDSPVRLARELVAEVGVRLEDADAAFAGLAQLAGRFTRSLLTDRLGLDPDLTVEADGAAPGDDGAEAEPEPEERAEGASGADLVSDLAAELVAITALVTALYHVIEAQSVAALRRYGDAEARFSKLLQGHVDLDLEGVHDVPTLADRTRRRIRALQRRKLLVEDERPDQTVLDVLGHILQGLQEEDEEGDSAPVVRALDVQLLTDLTWSRLVEKTFVYPGWSDLLLDLSAQAEIETRFHGQPRPIIDDLRKPFNTLTSRYRRLTQDSWALRAEAAAADGVLPQAGRGLEPRLDFYDAAAQVVLAQAARRSAGRYGPDYGGPVKLHAQHPIATAFVTTFDLELEMALLAVGRRYAVIMPVHTYVGGRGGDPGLDTSLAWVGCVVTPGDGAPATDDLQRLLAPTEWFSLRHLLDDAELSDLPIVVRLNGCPLIDLPTLQDPAHATLRDDLVQLGLLEKEDEVLLQHALVIDEYTALLHATADVYVAPNEDRWGLPPALTAVPAPSGGRDGPTQWADEGNDRFWAFLGVQVGDHGIRHRLATQLNAPRLTDDKSQGLRPPDRAGAVVTRRIGSAERDLLHWQDFDIVREFSGAFEGDLLDYALHLDRGEAMSRDGCTNRGPR